MRILLAILPLAIVILLAYIPDGGFLLEVSLPVFLMGIAFGTITHGYWIRVLLEEKEFYKEFYEKNAVKPHRLNRELTAKHTGIVLPFYIFGFFVFLAAVFIFTILGIDAAYFLPLALGAFEGVPLSYFLMERGVII